MEKLTYSAAVHQENDLFFAICPEVGTVSQGNTLDEAIENLKEATELSIGKDCKIAYKIVDEEEFDRLEAEMMGESQDDEFWDEEDLIKDEDVILDIEDE